MSEATEIIMRIRRVIDHAGFMNRAQVVSAIMDVLDSTDIGTIGNEPRCKEVRSDGARGSTPNSCAAAPDLAGQNTVPSTQLQGLLFGHHNLMPTRIRDDRECFEWVTSLIWLVQECEREQRKTETATPDGSVDWMKEATESGAKVANYRGWLCTIYEDAETLEEAKAWCRRALDKERCPDDPRIASASSKKKLPKNLTDINTKDGT